MTMNELLVQALERRYNALLSDYAFNLNAGDPEQDRVALEMDDIDFELFQLKTSGAVPNRDSNWGDDCLAALDRKPVIPTEQLFFQGKYAAWLKANKERN